MATYAKFTHNGKIQTIALMEGLEADEVTSLLKTVFGITGSIVGILAEKGLVIPISLVCRSPQVIPDSTCKILVAKSSNDSSSEKATTEKPISNHQARVAAMEDNAADDEASSDDDEAAAQSVVNEISQFLDSLRRKNSLTMVQHQLLRRLLAERSALLFAAYSVAVSASDLEYLTEICKDIATSLQTDEGRTACEAQDEVLQVCDQLYLQGKITESQLLYLRHLTLIRDSSIANVYDEFQEHNSVTLFAKSLYDVANSHPFRSGDAAVEDGDDNDEGDDDEKDEEDQDEDDGEDEDEQDEQARQDISSGLIGVIVLMLRSETFSRMEAQVLLEMVQREDDYVLAAYELYLRDNNMEDLQDTLMRCVRLEIRKRVTDIQERELAALQEERNQEKAINKSNSADYDEATDADEEEDQDVDSENYESSKAATTRDFGLEAISLDSLLNELGTENLWKGVVPEQFVQAVFIAVYRKYLSVDQARALCDLFQANYDLVHAAWEVYVVQKDTVDFIDTLRRIVRDLNLQEIQQQQQEEAKIRKEAQQASAKAAQTAERARQAAQEGRQQAASASTSTAQQRQEAAQTSEVLAKKREVEEAKTKALQAIDQAKSELLKHSLDMMVKQQLVSEKSANDLYHRHLEGDKLTDAAIEAYASDRDVNEFIDTLQMLASHSKEELDILMGGAIAEQEKRAAKTSTAAGQDEEEDEDEEEETGAGAAAGPAESAASQRYLADAALQQIAEIVSEMLKNEMISAPVAAAFSHLIESRDQRLVEAYKLFMKNRNGTELIDTLLKIVIDSVQSGMRPSSSAAAAAAPTAPATAAAAAASTSSSSGNNSNASAASGSAQVLDKFDQKQIVDILFQSNALTAQQYNDICRMIESSDATLGRVFRRYETTKDVVTLVQDLQAMDRPSTTTSNLHGRQVSAASSTAAVAASEDNESDDDDDEEDDDEDEEDDDGVDQQAQSEDEEGDDRRGVADDDEEDGETLDEDDANLIERRFMQIIQNMSLSELEQTALRLAIAENDPAIRNAIDAFRTDLDEDRLIHAMRTAARAVIHRTLSSASRAEEDEEDAEENNGSEENDDEEEEDEDDDNDDEEGDDEDEPEDEDMDVDEMIRLNRAHYQNGNGLRADPENDEEDEEEDDEDGNDEEEDDEEEEDELGDKGVSLITSKSARDHVFPILVQELVKENIINRKDGLIIMKQFGANNPIISTALDRYDTNNDMAQLVDALQQMVENIDSDTN